MFGKVFSARQERANYLSLSLSLSPSLFLSPLGVIVTIASSLSSARARVVTRREQSLAGPDLLKERRDT